MPQPAPPAQKDALPHFNIRPPFPDVVSWPLHLPGPCSHRRLISIVCMRSCRGHILFRMLSKPNPLTCSSIALSSSRHTQPPSVYLDINKTRTSDPNSSPPASSLHHKDLETNVSLYVLRPRPIPRTGCHCLGASQTSLAPSTSPALLPKSNPQAFPRSIGSLRTHRLTISSYLPSS